MTEKLETISKIISAAGFDEERRTLERIDKYHELFEWWGSRMNLSAFSGVEIFTERHIVDCLHFLRCLRKTLIKSWPPGRIVDVGSGGGFPGLVLAICDQDLRVTCVEATERKVSFLRTVVRVLGLENVRVLNSFLDPRDPGPLWEDKFDVAISRATLPIPQWPDLGVRITKIGGYVGAMWTDHQVVQARKSFKLTEKLTRIGEATYRLKGDEEDRLIRIYRRVS
jgi:16S rRNA (guanine527-N7)-methyltransferase